MPHLVVLGLLQNFYGCLVLETLLMRCWHQIRILPRLDKNRAFTPRNKNTWSFSKVYHPPFETVLACHDPKFELFKLSQHATYPRSPVHMEKRHWCYMFKTLYALNNPRHNGNLNSIERWDINFLEIRIRMPGQLILHLRISANVFDDR